MTDDRPLAKHFVATRAIHERKEDDPHFAHFIADSLTRHERQDWGDTDEHDKKLNDEAYKGGGQDRTVSVYKIPDMVADMTSKDGVVSIHTMVPMPKREGHWDDSIFIIQDPKHPSLNEPWASDTCIVTVLYPSEY